MTGDSNSEPSPDAYNITVSDGYLADVYGMAATSQRFGYYDTFMDFDQSKIDSKKKRIDSIWLRLVMDRGWTV